MQKVTVSVGGIDYSDYLLSYELQEDICNVTCFTTFRFLPSAPLFDPGNSVQVWTNGTSRFVGTIAKTTKQWSGGNTEYTVYCQHRDIKKLQDWYQVGDLWTHENETCSSFLLRHVVIAGIYAAYDATADPIVMYPYKWYNPPLWEVVENVMTFAGIYLRPQGDGTFTFTDFGSGSDVAIDAEGITTRCNRVTSDVSYRSKALIYGTGLVYSASGSNMFPHDRIAILANPMIGQPGEAEDVADRLLDEYNRLVEQDTITVLGLYGANLGKKVRVYDKFDGYDAEGTITEINELADERGYRTDIVTNARCPKIYGFAPPTPPTIYTHKPMVVGVSYERDSVADPVNTARVWVTPDITGAWGVGSGSTFHYGTFCEWYDKSEGLTGDFGQLFTGEETVSTFFRASGIIRDPWSTDARGAWCCTTRGIFYTPKLLPPADQTTGDWDWTPWERIVACYFTPTGESGPDENLILTTASGSGAATIELVELKANDNTGIYVVATAYIASKIMIEVLQVDRSGNIEYLQEYDTTTPAVWPWTMYITPPYGDDKQWIEYATQANPVVNDEERAIDLATGTFSQSASPRFAGWASPIEPSGSDGLLSFTTSKVYSGVPAVQLSTYPNDDLGQWVAGEHLYAPGTLRDYLPKRFASWDGKHQRIYVWARIGERTGYTYKSVLRSDDSGATWSRQSTTGSAILDMAWHAGADPGQGFISGRAVANTMKNGYLETYCVIALPHYDVDAVNWLFVSSDDGQNFWTSGSFPNPIYCIMDMDNA